MQQASTSASTGASAPLPTPTGEQDTIVPIVAISPDEVDMVTPSPNRPTSRLRTGDTPAGAGTGAGGVASANVFPIMPAPTFATALTSSLSPYTFNLEGSGEAKDPLFYNTPSKDPGVVPLNLDSRFSPNTPVNLLRLTPSFSANPKQSHPNANNEQHLANPPPQPNFEHLTPATPNPQAQANTQAQVQVQASAPIPVVTSAPIQVSQPLQQHPRPYSRFVRNAHPSQGATSAAMPAASSQLPPGTTAQMQALHLSQMQHSQAQAHAHVQAQATTQAMSHQRHIIDRELNKYRIQKPRVEYAPSYHLHMQMIANANATQQTKLQQLQHQQEQRMMYPPGLLNGTPNEIVNHMISKGPTTAARVNLGGASGVASSAAGSVDMHRNQPIAPLQHARVQPAKKSGTSKRSRSKAVPKPQLKKYTQEEALRMAAAMDRPPTRKSSKGGWTPREDDMLRVVVMENNERNWKNIAKALNESFPGANRNDVQCLHRWQKVLQPGLKKGPWTTQEDQTICELVNKLGANKWSSIAKQLPGRIGKQCRERWFNHLKPDIKKEPWTAEEERILVEQHAKHGNKWALIATHLPGRTDNAIKNHYNATQRRAANKKLGRKTKKRASESNPSSASNSQDPAMGKTQASAPVPTSNAQSSNSTLSTASTGNTKQAPAPTVTALHQNVSLAALAAANQQINSVQVESAPVQPRKRRKALLTDDMVGNTNGDVRAPGHPREVETQEQVAVAVPMVDTAQPMQVEAVELVEVGPMLGNSVYEVDKENTANAIGLQSDLRNATGADISLSTPLRERSMNIEFDGGPLSNRKLSFATPRGTTVRKPRASPGTVANAAVGNTDPPNSTGKGLFSSELLDLNDSPSRAIRTPLSFGAYNTPPRDLSRSGSGSRTMALGAYLTPLNGKSPGSMFLNMSPLPLNGSTGLTPIGNVGVGSGSVSVPPFGMLSGSSARKDGYSLPPIFPSPGQKDDEGSNPFSFSPLSRRHLNFETSAGPATRSASRLHHDGSADSPAGATNADSGAPTATLDQVLDQAESDK